MIYDTTVICIKFNLARSVHLVKDSGTVIGYRVGSEVLNLSKGVRLLIVLL